MILRTGLNFGAHFMAGLVFATLAACAVKTYVQKRGEQRPAPATASPDNTNEAPQER